MGEIAGSRLHFTDAQDALMQAFRLLELHFRTGAVACGFGGLDQGGAVGSQELLEAGGFTAIFVDGNRLLAGTQAAVHLAVNAAGVLGDGTRFSSQRRI